eukprot:1596938-Prymnesium_polylepis.1
MISARNFKSFHHQIANFVWGAYAPRLLYLDTASRDYRLNRILEMMHGFPKLCVSTDRSMKKTEELYTWAYRAGPK